MRERQDAAGTGCPVNQNVIDQIGLRGKQDRPSLPDRLPAHPTQPLSPLILRASSMSLEVIPPSE